jgi:hypothetical protein
MTMKTITLTTVLLALNVAVFATVWRVSNLNGSDADFTTLQAAHDAASSGDTIHVEGSHIFYGIATITKQLTIIGPGYFLDQNPATQANKNPAKFNSTISFSAGSAGSKIMGCEFHYYLYLGASNITIERNHFVGYSVYSNAAGLTDISIVNNYFNVLWYSYGIYLYHTGSNILIANNINNGYTTIGDQYFGVVLLNNVFGSSVSVYNAVVTNNILSYNGYSGINSVATYNIGNSTQFGNQNGNQQNVNMYDVFLYTGSTDGQYMLKPASPAIGAGESGVDCGAYGGNTPYVLSGMPPIPAIYSFQSTSIPSSTINVSISAKSHN